MTHSDLAGPNVGLGSFLRLAGHTTLNAGLQRLIGGVKNLKLRSQSGHSDVSIKAYESHPF
jgi:hypothetical protein